ncbi:MAG: peptidoglycan-associated lipoprotein Pal [Pseudomonadota bacterium]
MTTLSKTLLVVTALAVSACSQNPFDRFGGGSGAGAGGIDSAALDPASPAYFAETIGDRVLFEVDQSVLTPEAQSTLAAQARWLQDNGTYTAIIEGHADEQGTREYNLALGARRASAARDYLVANGVADNRLRTVTYGKERPIEICSSEECYAKNRRSVTVISAGLGS